MKQRFLPMSFISLLAMLGFVISNVSATSGIAAYYVGSGETYEVALDGQLKTITNNTAHTIFIPSRTLTEQQSFLNNIPSGVLVRTTPTCSMSSVTKTYGDASFTITHDTNSTGAKTFSSSNTAVATITNAGVVTIVGAGTTTITFNTAATEDHCAGTATATLTVVCAATFLDTRDNQEYPLVQIGNRCWMQKNLNYETGSSYCYNNNTSNCTTYGRLYTWTTETVNDACPTGWRMPTHNDWTDLERAICTSGTCLADFPYDDTTTGYRGTDEGSKLSTRTLNGNNSSGFTALMSGYRNTDGSFYGVGSYAYFWSSSEGGAGAWRRNLNTSHSTVGRSTGSKASGWSVRCLKN